MATKNGNGHTNGDRQKQLRAAHERFCYEYLVDYNATAAYRRAGYRANGHSAEVSAHDLLRKPEVAERIALLQAEQAARCEVTADEVVRELKRIAFLDPRRVMSWGPNGVTFNPSDELSESDARCISECSETVTKDGGTIRVKLADKVAALQLLGKHLGMFTDRVEHSGSISVPVNNDAELSPAAVAASNAYLEVIAGRHSTPPGDAGDVRTPHQPA